MKKQLIILMLGVLLASGCEEKPVRPSWVYTGAIVKVKFTGEKVQMRGMYYWGESWNEWRVTCLVKSGRKYRDGVVSKDSYVGSYATFRFWLHELEPLKEKE